MTLRRDRESPVQSRTAMSRGGSAESFASQCLSEFLSRLARLDPHPTVLDLGVLCGGNIAFLGSRGCRVSVESLPSVTRPAAPPPDQANGKPVPGGKFTPKGTPATKHARAAKAAAGASTLKGAADSILEEPIFVEEAPDVDVASTQPIAVVPAHAATVKEAASPLSYPAGSFSGILAWDAISRMPAQEAIGFVETLRKLLDDGGVILAYFPGPPGNTGGAAGRYRIHGEDRVEVEPAKELHAVCPAYQNREIYALFARFEVIRLSHLKSGTREVLVAKTKRGGKD